MLWGIGPAVIEKQEFYHGVAMIRLLDDQRCQNIQRHEFGYLVNTKNFVFLKYSTKTRTPWRFGFSQQETAALDFLTKLCERVVVALGCGGDGICAVNWLEGRPLMDVTGGWLCARRGFKECYAVSGPNGQLRNKVPLNLWPAILLDEHEQMVLTTDQYAAPTASNSHAHL